MEIDNQSSEIAPKPVPPITKSAKSTSDVSPTIVNPIKNETDAASNAIKKSQIFQD
jgi:hypothetical protein